MSILIVNITKWDDYNPEKHTKAKAWSWFRFEHSFFTNPDFAEVPPAEKWVWPYLLGECSKKKRGDRIKLNTRIMSSLLQISEDQVHWMIAWLVKEEMIEVIEDQSQLKPVPLQEVTETDSKLIPNVAQIDSKCRPNFDENPPYERTERNETITNPPNPLDAKGGVGRKKLDAIAEVVLSTAIGARRDCLEEPGALERIGEVGWRLLLFEFRSWEGFCTAFNREHKAGFEGRFKTQALRSMKSAIRLANQHGYAPDIKLAANGALL